MTTSIEWTRNADGSEGETWNPIRARRKDGSGKAGHYCQKISPGCKNCYAEAMNIWRGNGIGYTVPDFAEVELYLDQDALIQPMRWKKPRNIFVCSMTDLYADFVPSVWLDSIYAVMAHSARHTFMVLTKRPARRLAYMAKSDPLNRVPYHFHEILTAQKMRVAVWPGWPLPNVREGLSVCTQKEADELIPMLRDTPAAMHWLSMEPILESITIPSEILMRLDWVVVGGESGTKARRTDMSAIRSVVNQCQAVKVPVFVKQTGKKPIDGIVQCTAWPVGGHVWTDEGNISHFVPHITDAKGGNMDEWPADLRVRQMPEVR